MAVSKEPNGTWTVQSWYRDWSNVRRKKTKRGFVTKGQAIDWEHDFQAKVKGSPDMLFADFCKLYHGDMAPRLKLNTLRTKEYVIKGKILPAFGNKRLCDISPADIMNWQSALMRHVDSETGKGYSKTYLRTVNNILCGLLNHAVRYYNLSENPMSKTGKIGSSKGREMQVWTKGEYLTFSDAVADKPTSFALFEVLYWCGIREGEALALMPEDFDFGKKLLSITKSYQRIKGEDIITDPKTAKSNRVIVIPDFVAAELADYIDYEGYENGDRIFPVSKSYLYHEMERGCKMTGIKRIRVHDLRHSHVSLLVDLGFNVLAIADRMGHESIDITLRYAHLFPNAQTSMAHALSKERGLADE